MPQQLDTKLISWASQIEPDTVQQALKSARLDVVSGHIALMPDAHVGIGATVGSVIPTEGAVIPSAVGVDIGCGMIASELSLTAADLPGSLDAFLKLVPREIPAGLGQGHLAASRDAEAWLATHPCPAELTTQQCNTTVTQLGTLGSGNHFFEVCLDERDVVWLVLHSGSRGIGNQLANVFIKRAKELHKLAGTPLEDPDLAYFIEGTSDFKAYIDVMLWAQDYALENRKAMMDNALRAFFRFVGHGGEVDRINCHHNFTQRETHGGRELWITRKGAIQANVTDRGVIPGSMGAQSFIVRGLGNHVSYNSASHGAGRRMSRGEAKRTITEETLRGQMAGRSWLTDNAAALLDEAPDAYKDIGTVMADQADLVAVEHELHQILNYKGVK